MEKDNYGLEVLAISKLTDNKMPFKHSKKGAVALLSVKTHAERNFSLTWCPANELITY